MDKINEAIEALKRGEAVLIYDAKGREEETDIVVAGEFTTPSHIRTMRKEGGGLICVAVHPKIADRLKIPFLVDVWKHASRKYAVMPWLLFSRLPVTI